MFTVLPDKRSTRSPVVLIMRCTNVCKCIDTGAPEDEHTTPVAISYGISVNDVALHTYVARPVTLFRGYDGRTHRIRFGVKARPGYCEGPRRTGPGTRSTDGAARFGGDYPLRRPRGRAAEVFRSAADHRASSAPAPPHRIPTDSTRKARPVTRRLRTNIITLWPRVGKAIVAVVAVRRRRRANGPKRRNRVCVLQMVLPYRPAFRFLGKRTQTKATDSTVEH